MSTDPEVLGPLDPDEAIVSVGAGESDRPLIERTGRAAFWNAVLLPLLALLNLAFSVVVRRRFGLLAGVYDTCIGVLATVLLVTSLGIPTSLTKFLPEVEVGSGRRAVAMLLRRVATVRLLLLAAALVPMNLFAEPLAAWLDLGDEGVLLLRLLTVLVVARALIDLSIKTLNAFFAQLHSNLLALLQGGLDIVLVGVALVGGYQIGGVIGMLAVSALVTAATGAGWVHRVLGRLRDGDSGAAADPGATVASQRDRFGRFAVFTFLFELSIYFSDKGFSSPALAVILGAEQVAVFTTGFNMAFMTVGLVVASFRGLYRPMFAHLRARQDPQQLQRAFVAVSKAQLLLLLPAGIGLAVMAGDYVPLLFGVAYEPAVPIARIMVALMYTQTAFNLGIIWLSIDEQYRTVLWTQSILVIAAPFFLIVAGSWGLVWAALLFGTARVVVSVAGYGICHARYGFRFPWAFALKVAGVAAAMGAALAWARVAWGRSPLEAVALTAGGVVIYLVGLRLARVVGKEELELLERSNVPGRGWALAWLSPGGTGASG